MVDACDLIRSLRRLEGGGWWAPETSVGKELDPFVLGGIPGPIALEVASQEKGMVREEGGEACNSLAYVGMGLILLGEVTGYDAQFFSVVEREFESARGGSRAVRRERESFDGWRPGCFLFVGQPGASAAVGERGG